jgi:leader peptidase (prepilin peptidase) / N-methyltransferase
MTALVDIAAYQNLYENHLWIAAGFVFLVGAMLASFGGVLIERLPIQEGWIDPPADLKTSGHIAGRSRCEGCGTPISALALVPILGWLVSRGKARCCGASIPARYPLTELAMGAVFALSLVTFPDPRQALAFMLLAWLCHVMSVLDLRHFWLPATITTPLIWLGLIASPFESEVILRVFGGLMGMGLVWATMTMVGFLSDRDHYAGGDISLACVAGAWLGFDYVLPFLMIGSVLFVLQHLLFGKKGEGLPFGPALSVALLAVALSIAFAPGFLTLGTRV